MRITLSNAGPNDARLVGARTELPAFLPVEVPVVFFQVPEDPCDTGILSEQNQQYVVATQVEMLPAGSSITCVVGLQRRTDPAMPSLALNFTAAAFGFGALDPNSGNDQVVVVLGIFAVSVPTTDSIALVALGFLLLTLGRAGLQTYFGAKAVRCNAARSD